MNEITCRYSDFTAINASVFALNMYYLKVNILSDILMTVWVQWYAKNVYILELTSILKGFDNISKIEEVHCLVVYSRFQVLLWV